MYLYHVPAQGSVDDPEGIRPAFPEGVSGFAWGGNYDFDTHMYVIRTEEPVEGLGEFEFSPDDADHVKVDFSGLIVPLPVETVVAPPPSVD